MQYLDYIRSDKFIVLDLETTGLNPRQDEILSVAWWSNTKSGFLFVAEYEDEEVTWQQKLIELLPEISDPATAKVFHNAIFDTSFLSNNSVSLKGPIICSIILAQMVNENRKLGLDNLAKIHLEPDALKAYYAIEAWRVAHNQKSGDYSQAPRALLREYNLEDVRNTYKIAKISVNQIDNTDKFLRKMFKFAKTPVDYLENEGIPFESSSFKLSNRGIKINLAAVEKVKEESEKIIGDTLVELNKLTSTEQEVVRDALHEKAKAKKKTQKGKDFTPRPDFNWASGAQVGSLLYDVLGLKKYYVGKSETGQYSTSSDHINTALLKDLPQTLKEVLLVLLKLKAEQKFLSTDILGLLKAVEGDKLYPVFKQTSDDKTPGKGTATGRLSSARNVQNIPPRARHFYIPSSPDNIFVYADYSQLELRIAASLSSDKRMLEVFAKDGDIHELTARSLFPDAELTKEKRKIAKTSNFLKIYGGSPGRHQQQLFHDAGLVLPIEELREIDRRYFEFYSDYKRFLNSLRSFLIQHKFIYSPSGRIRRLPVLEYASGLNRVKRYYVGKDYTKLKAEQEKYNKKNKSGLNLYEYVSKIVRHAINQGLNFPGQSFGATICKLAVMALHEAGYDVANNIHDAVLIELPKNNYKKHLPIIKNLLENVYRLKVPLKVEMKVLNSFSEEDIYESK